MKIGIDIGDQNISRAVKNELKQKGHFIVDMSLGKDKKIGNEVFKKVILANNSRLDFYINLQMIEGNGGISLFTKNKKNSNDFCNYFMKELKELSIKNISINNGEKYYLIKNIKVPTVIIKVNKEELLNIKKEEFAKKIVFSILKL